MSKAIALAALKPLIFFDDNLRNCDDACVSTPTVRIPVLEKTTVVTLSSAVGKGAKRPETFLSVCKVFLRTSFDDHEPALRGWHQEHLTDLSDDAFDKFTAEFERSAKGTPAGRQRRAAGARNEDVTKLLLFAANLKRKYSA